MKKNKLSKNIPSKPKVKRKKRRKAKKVVPLIGMSMEQIYGIINSAQVQRIEQKIIIDPQNHLVVENILKDCQIQFTKTVENDGINYILQPPPKKAVSDETFAFKDELPDELLEDGFCF